MTLKSVDIDFGAQKLSIQVPSNAAVVEFKDPPFLPDPKAAIREAFAAPLGMPPLRELAKPGMTVAIGFDDITRPSVPPRTILPILIEELLASGIKRRDIVLIGACSNHRKNTRGELAAHLGIELFNSLWPTQQILNHDCMDATNLTYFGVTDGGRVVEMNRRFVEADLMIYQGNVSSAPWKAYTGTGVCVGLASTRSIASHHSFHAIPLPKSAQSGDERPMTHKKRAGVKEEMTAYLDKALGREVFYINAVTGRGGKLAGVFAGNAAGTYLPASTLISQYAKQSVPQADVLVIGLPSKYAYGTSDNTLIATVGACVPARCCNALPVIREGGVIIATVPSAGIIDPDRFPSYQPVIDLYGKCFDVRELVDHEDEFNNRADFRHKYTYGYAYPPLHAFWLMYEIEYAIKRASAVIIAGTTNPGAFRQLGLRATRNFEDAWKIAEQNVGKTPTTVVAPTFYSSPRFKFDVSG